MTNQNNLNYTSRLNDVKNRISQIDQRKSSKISELKQLNIMHAKFKEKPDTKIQVYFHSG